MERYFRQFPGNMGGRRFAAPSVPGTDAHRGQPPEIHHLLRDRAGFGRLALLSSRGSGQGHRAGAYSALRPRPVRPPVLFGQQARVFFGHRLHLLGRNRSGHPLGARGNFQDQKHGPQLVLRSGFHRLRSLCEPFRLCGRFAAGSRGVSDPGRQQGGGVRCPFPQ